MDNTEYTIESNIPLPKRCCPNGGRKLIYPFDKMNIGDSFFISDKSKMRVVAQSACSYQRRHKGYKFVTRAENNGLRIWRVES